MRSKKFTGIFIQGVMGVGHFYGVPKVPSSSSHPLFFVTVLDILVIQIQRNNQTQYNYATHYYIYTLYIQPNVIVQFIRQTDPIRCYIFSIYSNIIDFGLLNLPIKAKFLKNNLVAEFHAAVTPKLSLRKSTNRISNILKNNSTASTICRGRGHVQTPQHCASGCSICGT